MQRSLALTLVVALAGCGVYSVRLDPPPERGVLRSATPLDLSVSLGDVRSEADGRVQQLDAGTLAAVDADFVRVARASGLFRDVRPRGESTDVYVDTVRALHSVPMTPARAGYLVLVAPLAFLTPGFPHPWDYRVTRTVHLRGEVRGASIGLPSAETGYDERVWGANYWGGLATDPLRPAEGEYLVADVRRIILASEPLFRRFEAAARAGNVEDAWLVGIEAARVPPSR